MILVDVDKQSQNDHLSRRSNLTSQITRGTTTYIYPNNKQFKKYPKIRINDEPEEEEQIVEDFQPSEIDKQQKKVSNEHLHNRTKPKF